MDVNGDNILAVEDVLAPTFDPQRLDRRTHWELDPPQSARAFLRQELRRPRLDTHAEKVAKGEVVSLEEVSPGATRVYPRGRRGDPRRYLDPMLYDVFLLDPALKVLPSERQQEVVYALYTNLIGDEPGAETWHAAQELGVSPETIRGFRAKVARNPEFRRVARLLCGPELGP
jgi:hypothetical protein